MGRTGSFIAVAVGLMAGFVLPAGLGSVLSLGDPAAAAGRAKRPALAIKEFSPQTGPRLLPRLYPAPFAGIAVAPNPYVPSGFRASADYNYLYTQTSTYVAQPSVASYRYAPDRRFLFTPASGANVVASAYSWSYLAACKTLTGSGNDPERVEVARNGDFASSRGAFGSGLRGGDAIADASRPNGRVVGEARDAWRVNPTPQGVRLPQAGRGAARKDVDLTYFCRERNS